LVKISPRFIDLRYNLQGGDLVSTWVAKPEGHVEEITNLVKKVIKLIVANKKRNYVNDTMFASEEEGDVAVAA
jgi:hypothetical protein